MDKANAKVWFGADTTRLDAYLTWPRQPEWAVHLIYAPFMRIKNRPYGVNNKVFPDVGMPHVLMELQGMPACAAGHGAGSDELDFIDVRGCHERALWAPGNCSGGIHGRQQSLMQPIYDLVNFLAYTAEPMKTQRQRMGIYVLLFLVIFLRFLPGC